MMLHGELFVKNTDLTEKKHINSGLLLNSLKRDCISWK